MKTYVAELQSKTAYMAGRYYEPEIPTLTKEGKDEYEKRTWRNRIHTDEKGNVLISALAFKNCLAAAAKYLGMQIPGKGKATYTKHFKSGVLVSDPLILPIKKDAVEGTWLFVPADGVTGSGKRVLKCFPTVKSWSGKILIHVLDETVTKDVLETHLQQAGDFIGLGSMRVQNGGICGRFRLVKLTETK